MTVFEKTVRETVRFEGVGLHTGLPSSVAVHPAEPGTGIVFVRTDRDPNLRIPAVVENVERGDGQGRQTSLRSGDVRIGTIEHLMAALHGLGVDNALIEVEGEELPGLDGSAIGYYDRIRQSGLTESRKERRVIAVKKPLYVDGKNHSMAVLPAENFSISYTLSYDHADLPDQFVHFEFSPEIFEREIAPARTFCLKEEAEALLKLGYGRGANYQNTLVFEEGEPIGNALRFPDEAARHKVLDLVGDLYLAGCGIRGHVITFKTGHRQNYELVKAILESAQRPVFKRNEEEAAMTSKRRELDVTELKKIIPHRYPFLFVDRIIDLEPGKKAVGVKNVSVNDYFFQGHFPGHPIMPGVLIIEALAQVGGVVMLSVYENHGKIAYFMSIDHAKFRQPVYPGDTLRLEVEVVKSRSKTGQCVGRAYVGEKLVCEAEVKFAVVDAGEAASEIREGDS